MSRLNLPTCPICQAQNSLSRETMDRAGQTFTWYQCQDCGSVLLWLGDDRWTYQKIGREDQTHLLRQPLTVAELQSLAGVPDAPHEASEPPVLDVPIEEPDAPLVAPSPPMVAVPAEEPDEAYEAFELPLLDVPTEEPGEAFVTPAPPAVPDKERRGPSRWLLLALAVIGLIFVCTVVALLVANQLGY